MTNKLILILGMHRSGTSSMAGSFYHAGYNLGDYVGGKFDSLDGKTEGNKKGHYEDSKIRSFNTNILLSMGTDWHLNWDKDFLLPYLHGHPQFSNIVVQLKNLIKDEFKFYNKETLVYKDPRISLLLPIYYKALIELNAEKENDMLRVGRNDTPISTYLVIMRRNNLEIAQSLHKRNPEISIENGLVLADKYYTYCAHEIENNIWSKSTLLNFSPRLYLADFAKFIENPIQMFEEMSENFGFNILDTEEKRKSVRDFVDPKLRRNKVEQ